MKKIILTLLLIIFMIPGVNAEDLTTTYDVMQQDFIPISNFNLSSNSTYYFGTNTWIYTDFDSFYSDEKNRNVFNNLYNELMNAYSLVRTDYPYYKLSVLITSSSSDSFKLHSVALRLRIYNNESAETQLGTLNIAYHLGTYYSLYALSSDSDGNFLYYTYNDAGYDACYNGNNCSGYETSSTNHSYSVPFNSIPFRSNDNGLFFIPTLNFETNTHHVIQGTTDIWNLYDSESNLISTYSAGDEYPYMYFENNFSIKDYLTIVNLDDYEYIILSLKDYSQTEAFSSTLHIQGMIGITPVYEFGTIEKTNVTDRCNASYSELTDYKLYVLASDLTNNAVYYVKSCEDGSILEFDNTIFDITYITADTVNDPVVTVGGVQYNVIPFNELSTTANSNESNNYVPGANEAFTPISNITNYVSSFWDSLSTFMGLVTKFFNTLPIEIRAVSITLFTTACTLGLLKILKS